MKQTLSVFSSKLLHPYMLIASGYRASTHASLQLELQIAIVNHEMAAAAGEERFSDAATFRDRLEGLRLKQRCLELEHIEELRSTICHHLGKCRWHFRNEAKVVKQQLMKRQFFSLRAGHQTQTLQLPRSHFWGSF